MDVAPMLGVASGGVLLSVAWTAFKVGALSYGGGFVIIPLMQSDAVSGILASVVAFSPSFAFILLGAQRLT